MRSVVRLQTSADAAGPRHADIADRQERRYPALEDARPVTGVRELIQVRVVSAAPEHVRLSVLGDRTQLDISLPLDVTVADATPELVRLVQSRGKPNSRADDAVGKDAQRNYWALAHPDSDAPLPSDMTLREAGATNGALLRLFDERALSAPTLYDDVVDAAARLNKASFAGWDGAAAKH